MARRNKGPTRVVRLPTELVDRMEAEATERGVTIREHFETQLADADGRATAPAASTPAVPDPAPEPAPVATGYVCPAPRCPKTFGSPSARCPIHGRPAVPA